ncbi:MAG TPA: acetate/propionate family kinase [Steroidobacteraceae bacterium]|nr:acetate/propionate family kinase [Steroidobacteraceae bacterium]
MSNILTINGGSSSIRFAIFAAEHPPRRLLQGKVDRIGSSDATLSADHGAGHAATDIKVDVERHVSAIGFLLDWLETQPAFESIGGVGHRVVHGMQHTDPEIVTQGLLDELKSFMAFDPEHLPREIELIETLRHRYGTLPQVVCFDTAFHRSMPLVSTQLPIPRRYAAKGVQRYGFHGLSYTFLLQELGRLGDTAAATGRVILAHLGSGASLAAVRDGRCIDTSMGFTPTAGLVMGTRSGDLDPGVMSYLALTDAMTAVQFRTMVNHESGLLGISESSADVRDLLGREASDRRAAEALALFCYQAKKWIGAFAAALGGLNTLVFAGGIGENAAPVRKRICDGLEYLGIDIDESANDRHAPRISTETGSVAVRVIRTDEESVIAALSIGLLKLALP